MKKKGLFMTGAAVLAAAGILAGCGGAANTGTTTTGSTDTTTASAEAVTAQSVAKMVSENMTDVKSYTFDSGSRMGYSMSASGVNMNMNMDMKLAGEGVVDSHNVHMTMDLNMSAMGQESTTKNEAYALEENGKYVVYSKTEGEGSDGKWTRAENDTVIEFDKLNNIDVYKEIADGKIEATLSEGEKINGKDVYKLTAVIPGELFEKAYAALGQDSSGGIAGMDFSSGTADCELYIYKDTGLPARTYMDAKNYSENIFKQALTQSSENTEDIEVTVETFDVDMTMDNYNTIDKIEVPAEVLSAV